MRDVFTESLSGGTGCRCILEAKNGFGFQAFLETFYSVFATIPRTLVAKLIAIHKSAAMDAWQCGAVPCVMMGLKSGLWMSKSLGRVRLSPVLKLGSCSKQAAVVRVATAHPAIALRDGPSQRSHSTGGGTPSTKAHMPISMCFRSMVLRGTPTNPETWAFNQAESVRRREARPWAR